MQSLLEDRGLGFLSQPLCVTAPVCSASPGLDLLCEEGIRQGELQGPLHPRAKSLLSAGRPFNLKGYFLEAEAEQTGVQEVREGSAPGALTGFRCLFRIGLPDLRRKRRQEAWAGALSLARAQVGLPRRQPPRPPSLRTHPRAEVGALGDFLACNWK